MAQIPNNESSQNIENELYLLEALTATPETTQADLAVRVGIAVGTVNWYLKRWSKRGYITVQRVGRWKWRYLLTAQGMARKRQLAGEYLEASFALYRRLRLDAQRLLHEVHATGTTRIMLRHNSTAEAVQSDEQLQLQVGCREVLDICRLTCLEFGLVVVEQSHSDNESSLPILCMDGIHLELQWPSGSETVEPRDPQPSG